MISSEVQRTLVKSPPELWTELSDPAKLARHLCELGEIRITGTDPEQLVEWEADAASGTVLIKPAGWGTKVTLRVVAELPTAEPPATPQTAEVHASPAPHAAIEPEAPSAPSPQPGPAAEPLSLPRPHAEATREDSLLASLQLLGVARAESEPEPEAQVASEPEPDAEVQAQPEGEPEPDRSAPDAHEIPAAAPASSAEAAEAVVEPELVPRRGFFARLFARRPRAARAPASGTSEADAAAQAESEAPPSQSPETAAGPQPEDTSERRAFDRALDALPPAAAEPPREPSDPPGSAPQEPAREPAPHPDAPAPGGDISAELRKAEEVAAEHVQAVLTSVLDRLGAAHHRPFSRA